MNPVVGLIAALVVLGGIALVVVSARVRTEIDALLQSFDRAERTLTPLVAVVRSDRNRLADRLATLTGPGPKPDSERR